MAEQTAFCKATAELGDISALADEISLKRKQEVCEEMFMNVRRYMTTGRVALFVLGGAVFCFGLILVALTWFNTGIVAATLGSGLVFCGAGAVFLTYFGLTQETASRYPMSRKRALLYALDVSIFAFGAFSFSIVLFSAREYAVLNEYLDGASEKLLSTAWPGAAVATLIPFVLPSIALFVFLFLTEKDRSKPWLLEMKKRAVAREAEMLKNPVQFGLISGAIWIAAVALFIVLTISVGLRYSWLSFVGAIVLELLLQAKFFTAANK
jgi:hypothetical protein